ncbi:hypothetical protein N867_17655 [Actinotalea fermentans ATCC 43279 = JCM 9966 = DSM 3133]|nr:hypothetical protein N867_17655 [Actinotalea fermentans ATCC 43279 = JCM 9966 = DSM 3133]
MTAALVGASALLAAGALAGCEGSVVIGDGDAGPRQTITQELSSPVTKVDIGTSGTMTVVVGDEPSLTITAGDQVIREITAVVHGDTLDIDLPGAWFNTGRIEYELVLPALSSISVRGSVDVSGEIAPAGPVAVSIEGSGDVDVTGADGADEVLVDIEGSGDVALDDLDAQAVTVAIDGSGSVRLAGTTASLDVSIPGSGEVDADGLLAADVRVAIEGSGDARVHAERTLDVRIDGSGEVRYTGDPQVSEDIDGSGDVGRA